MTKPLKPLLRFNSYNEDWEQRKLIEFVDKAVDNRGKTPPLDENGTHPLIEVASLGGVHPNYSKIEKYLNDDTFENNLRAYIKKGDILFTTVGSIGIVSLMDSREEAAIAQNIVAFRAKENFAPEYLYALFSNEENQYKAKRIVMGAVQPSIKVSQLVDVEYMLTTNEEEQKKIGSYFRHLDNLITLHQRKLDTLKVVKKSMLEKMFPREGCKVPEVRFSGFTEDWEQRKLGCLIDELKSGLSRMLSEEDIGVPVVRANNINNEHLDLTKDIKYWFLDDPKGVDISNYLIHEKDVLINFINSESKMGSCAIVEKEPNRATIYTTNILRMKLNEDKCDNHFFLAKSLTKEYKDYIKGISKIAVNQASFTTVDFKNFDISLPSVGEQRKIGFFFQQLDNLITLHQRELELLQNVKKSLLEKMFV